MQILEHAKKNKNLYIKKLKIKIYFKEIIKLLKDTEKVRSIATAFGAILIIFFILYSIFLMPAPYEPEVPYPENGSKEVSPNTNLSWIGGNPSDKFIFTITSLYGNKLNPELTYYIKIYNETGDVYCRGVEVGDSKKIAISHKPSKPLKQGTKYSWKVTAENNFGKAKVGPEWNFITKDTDKIIFDKNRSYTKKEFIFNWDKVTENDENLIRFFKTSIPWIQNAAIKKDNNTIILSKDNESVSFKINENKNLTIDGNITKLKAYKEYNLINIYKPINSTIINITELSDNSINISFYLDEKGEIGIWAPIETQLARTKGLMLNYEGGGSTNTFEIVLGYGDNSPNHKETMYLVSSENTKSNTDEWKNVPREVLYEKFVMGWNNTTDYSYMDPINKYKVRSVHIKVSNIPDYGDSTGFGWVKLYDLRGIIE